MIFNVSSDDLQMKIAPVKGDYEISISDVFAPNDLDKVQSISEDKLLSALPHKYRAALTHIDEVLTWTSNENQVAFSTTYEPTGNSLKVYTDFPYNGRSFSLRTEDDLTEYTYTASGKNITFASALPKGTKVFVAYDHQSADEFLMLKEMVIQMMAIEISRRLYFHRDNEASQRFVSWQEEIDAMINAFHKGTLGVHQIDALILVNDPSTHSEVVEDFYANVLRW
jgi:hypothetical protein